MAFQTGPATSQEDLMSKLSTFAQANGWTQNDYSASTNRLSLSKNSVFVHFHWDAVDKIAVFQSLAYSQAVSAAAVNAGGTGYTVGDDLTVTGGTFTTAAVLNVDTVSSGVVTAVSVAVPGIYSVVPGDPVSVTGGTGSGATFNLTSGGAGPGSHQDDSGTNAQQSGAITQGRYILTNTNGAFPTYWFFQGNGTQEYIHVVLEVQTGVYRHFGFGELQKLGSWTGGEYVLNQTLGPKSRVGYFDASAEFPWTGTTDDGDDTCCIHCEGFPNQPVGGKWGVMGRWISSDTDAEIGNDTAGVQRIGILGGMLDGPFYNDFFPFELSNAQSFVPLIPIPLFYRDRSLTPERVHPMGFAPDMRALNIKNFSSEQEVTYGGETWVVFPLVAKTTSLLDSAVEQSGNAGYAYKKIT